MAEIQAQLMQLLGSHVPMIVGALVILIVGWLIALVVSGAIRKGLRRFRITEKTGQWFGTEEAKAVQVERWIGRGVYYVILLLAVVGFLQALGLKGMTEPINRFLNELFAYAPRLIGPAILLFVAWVLASVLRYAVTKGLGKARMDERLENQVGMEGEEAFSVTKTLGEAVYWLVFLLFLPAVLNALALQGLLTPVQRMVEKVLAYLPNLFGAGLILLVGWFIARIVQRLIASVAMAMGADRLSEQVGLKDALGKQSVSKLLGLVAYILIFVPTLIAALNALQLEAVTRPTSAMLATMLQALPAIFAAALVMVIAFFVGRVVSNLVSSLLANAGFNAVLSRLGLGSGAEIKGRTPSEAVGYLTLAAIMILGGIEAFELLGFEAVAELFSQFTVFAAQVVLAVVFVAIGLYIANLVFNTILASQIAQSRLVANVARVTILALAGAMALRLIGVADEIISLAFGLLLGAFAVAFAVAFGLGGRDLAARLLDESFRSIREQEEKKPINGAPVGGKQ